MRRFHPALVLLLAPALLAGCRRHHDPSFTMRDPSAPAQTLGPGDIRIYNSDSSVDLVLVGDTVSTGLSERVVARVRQEAMTSADSGDGLGGAIKSLVKKTVARAIGARFEFPLEEARDAHYENGALVFDWKDGKQRDLFRNSRVNDQRADKSFDQADAERFIAAFRARKRELGQ